MLTENEIQVLTDELTAEAVAYDVNPSKQWVDARIRSHQNRERAKSSFDRDFSERISGNSRARNDSSTNRFSDSLEEHCKREWDNSFDLREEFLGHFEAYLAFRKAEANGQVRIFNPSTRDQRR